MDRRTFLSFLNRQEAQVAAPMRPMGTFAPYSGNWGQAEAAHLLRRTLFGPKKSEIDWAANAGLNATLNELFKDRPMPNPPVQYYDTGDPAEPIGTVWVESQVYNSLNFYRKNSLLAWTVGQMLESEISIREKMTLFWHNHFSLEMDVVNDARFMWRYANLLRTNALGNFQELVEKITVEPAMLRYLNGNQNVYNANGNPPPNENYARELFELFSIGKGPQVGDGDYTTYTETDVREAARVLTGWRDRGYGWNSTTPYNQFRANKHDPGNKTFSAAFNGHTITNNGENEYKDLVQMIFNQSATAEYICRKLYRWFVYYEINDQTETDIIGPMALLLISSNYDIQPVVRALLGSQHFYDMSVRGVLIKNPLDYTVGMLRQTEVVFPDEFNVVARYRHWYNLYALATNQLMRLFNPPSVAGWPAYYQIPAFHEMWISSVTLPARFQTAERYNSEGGYNYAGYKTLIDPIHLINQAVGDVTDPNVLVADLATLMMPRPLTQSQKDFLKSVILPGLPDYEWTFEYTEFANNPHDPVLRASVSNKLRDLLASLMGLAEYQLS
ncbi:MAG: DUF1800 domain-containing protein [Bacteroidota bacterium]